MGRLNGVLDSKLVAAFSFSTFFVETVTFWNLLLAWVDAEETEINVGATLFLPFVKTALFSLVLEGSCCGATGRCGVAGCETGGGMGRGAGFCIVDCSILNKRSICLSDKVF